MCLNVLVLVFVFSVTAADPASEQLPRFKNKTDGPVGTMTTSNGASVDIKDTVVLNSPLISNEFFMDTITHFVREIVVERVVHAKGAGAFGYFEVTSDVTDICKAKFLNKVGKKTPVAVRFSHSTLNNGAPDTALDSGGFAIKFYTEDGNFDMLGFNTPIFPVKDPLLFPSLIRCLKRNPVTNFEDPNMLWDFITLRPETVFFFMHIFTINPDGYRHFSSHSIHTYQIYNAGGVSSFARFTISPDKGIKNLGEEEAAKIRATDFHYSAKDLYNAIENGDYPSWTVSLQVLTTEDVKNATFDVFDVTKILPLNKYPAKPIGKLVLNRNPKNYFAEVEQLAYGPNNLVPGILGGPDKLFEARRLAYREAHLYRLGANFNKIPVNCPLNNVSTYNRDGVPPVGSNEEDKPTYYPNSFNGPAPVVDENRPSLMSVIHDNTYNFDQAAEMYTNLSDGMKNTMIAKIVDNLRFCEKSIQNKAIKIFHQIHEELGSRISDVLTNTVSKN